MSIEDEENTAFVTDQRLYCYHVMPFGLKNARVTYQRLVNVDDMITNFDKLADHIVHLRETFEVLRKN